MVTQPLTNEEILRYNRRLTGSYPPIFKAVI